MHLKRILNSSTHKVLISLTLILISILLSPINKADFISLSGAETATNIAEIEIQKGTLHITFEISANDANMFWPEIEQTPDIYLLKQSALKQKVFKFQIKSGVKSIKPSKLSIRVAQRKQRNSPFAGQTDPRTGIKVPDFPSDKKVLLTQLEYPVSGVSDLEMKPPMGSDGLASVTIGFTSRHGQTPVSGFHYLSKPESFTIDWDDPWNTHFKNTDISRHNRHPLKSFLYVEPRQIRHEILLRTKDLMEWTNHPFDAWQPLSPENKTFLHHTVRNYLYNKNPTTIDQALSQPSSIETVFLRANNNGYTQISENETIEMGSVLIGYREKFSIEEFPQSVTVDWNLFTDTISSVPTLIQDPAGPFPNHVIPAFPDIQWHNYLYDYRPPNSDPLVIETPSLAIPMAILFSFLIITIIVLTLSTKHSLPGRKGSAIIYTIIILSAGALYFNLPEEYRVNLPGTAKKRDLGRVTEQLLLKVAAAYKEPLSINLELKLKNLITKDGFENTYTNLTQIYRPQTTSGSLGSISAITNLRVEYSNQINLNGNKGFRLITSWQAVIEEQSWGHFEQKPQKTRANIDIVQSDNYWKIARFTPLSVR
ncbi:hypothetical protein BTJ40_15595 [Microbulbifer sp. A4B17]|uniref:hypothetical protein n=1 Tax=Microbulbifer sp. A4B17 TaxID=359370 RepID=UPI000D52D451|nr:hypothetical protein [Microbulbifer sp. A4B17]AWF82141.1 hypothetical protein BTJ40_15595 [Microbulbifer sp. A4B17]